MQLFSKNLLIFLLVFIKCSHQEIYDPSFRNYCIRFKSQVVKQSIEKDDNGNEVLNPVGDRCKVHFNVQARDKDEARLYCERWGIFVLVDWDVDETRISCTYENVYECENNYQQIRGMCYQQFYELKTYEEAENTCKTSVEGGEILKIQSKHHGELLEANIIGDLTMYFVQPDKSLETSSQFVGPTKSDESDQNKNYVILYNYGIHYDVGPNTIIKLDKTIKAFPLCMYQPAETILSFAVKAKKLGLLYHATQLVGAMVVWRTASHYTPTNIPGYPNSHQDICEKSMKAILGTSDGTLLNLKPEITNLLSSNVKKSFIRAFGAFSYCEHTYNRILRHEIYFASKQVRGNSCGNQANLLENDYKADFKRKDRPYQYSFVYYPEEVGTSLNIVASRFALHSPILCGLHYNRDIHKANPLKAVRCDGNWITHERSSGLVCHYNNHGVRTLSQAREYCRELGAKLSTWDSIDEYNKLNKQGCSGGWVACISKYGCTREEEDRWGRHGVVSSGDPRFYHPDADGIHTFCEKMPIPTEEV